VLQCVAAMMKVASPSSSTCCSVLQCVAVSCSVLQVAACYSVLQCAAVWCFYSKVASSSASVCAMRYSALQALH